MYTASCPHCAATFSNTTTGRVLQGANLHIRTKHPNEHYLDLKAIREADAPTVVKAERKKPAAPVKTRTKRAYVKRVLKPETGTVVMSPHRHDFQYCPNCGLNLFIVIQAMQAAAKFSR